MIYIIILLILIIVLPSFRFFEPYITYPYKMRIFSLYMLIVFIITISSIYQFGLNVYKRTINNFIKYRNLNMETLITLGSLSSLLLTLYLIIERGFISIEHNMNIR